MRDRAARVLMVVVAVLLAFFVLQPYVTGYLFSAREPRPVAARGDLSEFERSTVRVFETVLSAVAQTPIGSHGDSVPSLALRMV